MGLKVTKRPRNSLAKPPVSYFVAAKDDFSFIPTGCTLLDCALGGGYPIGRIVNIVGDRSTAKTALATEAMTNFIRQYPHGQAAYRESEAAFDPQYAKSMGLDITKVDFGSEGEPLLTVEDFARDLDKFLDQQIKNSQPGIYVLDSLDALSDDAEMSNDIGKASYGMGKAKMLSTLFRKMTRKIEQAQVLLLIVSQVRENIGVTFGERYRRAGGKALDFYASIIFWLANIKTLKKTINKVERPYGATIRAKVKKNKISLPFRECDFDFIFGYGIDDLGASIGWLQEVGRLKDADIGLSEVKAYLKGLETMNDADFSKEQQSITAVVKRVWAEVEVSFLPIRQKYR